ncbi:DUF4240 domain-containing protein [Nocardia grenadensis]|uniref:DUF4240 domain-containing protein n=1 Tax=Nocardia grenadensis TaxID=931537 RepID=UPI003D8B6435
MRRTVLLASETAAEETLFWDLVDTAWAQVGAEADALRKGLAARASDDEAYALDPHLRPFLTRLRALGEELSSAELTALDRVAERKLHEIDRADIHEVTDGSDDGFLYCRGFIVAMGRDFHRAVLADPSVAVLDAECESFCYFFAHLHRERFGCFPETGSGISRETGRNRVGWSG